MSMVIFIPFILMILIHEIEKNCNYVYDTLELYILSFIEGINNKIRG
jgi:hypothetical protein